MNFFGTYDFGAYFGAEIRVIDGEEFLCVPLRYNPTIRVINRRPVALLKAVERAHPDSEGYTHSLVPHIPQSFHGALAEADFVKMTRPVGRLRPIGQNASPPPPPEPDPGPVLDHNTLAVRAVTDEDIPL